MASLFESLGINDEEQQAAPVKPEKTGVLRTMGDQVLSLGQGVVGGVKMLSDLAGPDNAVSQTLGEANTSMQGMFSASRAEEMKNRQALIDAADNGDSTLNQITTRLGGIAEAPIQTVMQAVGSMAPNIAAALATGGVSAGPGLVALAARFGVPAALGVGMGVGSVKGQNYEAVFNKAKQEGLSDDEAVSLGIKASEYSAQNAPQQALGGAFGMLDSLTGAERMITGMTRKAGAEVAAKPAQGLMRRTVLGAAEEAPAEGLQGAQGQYAQNEALNNAGFATNPWAGVAGAGINDAVVGAMVGGPMGALHNPARQAPVITPQQAEADAIRATELVPEAGAMTRAANVGTEAKARAVESAPPITPEDMFAQELASTQDDIRQSNTLQKMRDSASPTLGVTTDEFLAALSVAGDASARTDLRRLALDNIQGAVEHFKTGANLVPDVPQAPGTELATLNERATGMAEVNPAPEFDPNTLDGQTRFVDELGSQRAIGGPRALTYDDPAPVAPPPSRQAVPQLQAGDIQNKLGKPFTNLFAAKNVSHEAGPGYVPVKLGENAFVVRKVDTEINQAPALAAPTPAATETVATAQVEQTPDVQDVQPTPPAVAPAAKPTDHIGRNNKPLSEGGKPFKTKDEASEARKLQPMLRVVKSPTGKGFALAPKTEAQLAAQDKAAKRLSLARTGRAGVPTAAHEFIAGEGGMDSSTRTEFSFGSNPRVGNRTLFAGARGGLSLDAATEKLIEARYLPAGSSHSDTVALINRSFTQPQYTVDGTETVAQAEVDARFDDYLAAEQDAAQHDDFDPFESAADLNFTIDDAEMAGYDAAEDPIKLEVNALLAQAGALGIETSDITEQAYEDTRNGSEQDYYDAARAALAAAIETSTGNSRQDAGAQGNAGSEEVKQNSKANESNAKVAPSLPGIYKLEDGQYARFQDGIWFRRMGTPREALKTEFPSYNTMAPKDRGDGDGWTPHSGFTLDAYGATKSLKPFSKSELATLDAGDSAVLTAPSRAEVLAQQDRTDNAQALDDKAQIDAEAQHQTLTQQTAPEQRTDTSGDMFAVEKAQAVIDKRNAGVEKAKDPNQAGMFDEPAQEDADELSQPIDQLRKIARDDDHPDSQEARSELARHGLGYGHGNSDHLIIGSMKPPSEEWMQVQNFRQRGVYELAASDLKRFLKLAKARSLDAFEGQAISDRDSTISKWLAESKPTEPANQATAILDAANVTGKERIDALKDIKKGDITPDELKAAYPANESDGKAAESKPSTEATKPPKIEDSGQVLEGARKLYAKNYAAKLDEGTGMDTATVPLSKSWPEPDYQRLIDEGADPWAVAMTRAMRDEVPTKPSSWKLKGWVQKVETLRDMTSKVMSGEMTQEKFKTTGGQFNLADWFNKIDLYGAVGHSKSLKTLKFSMGEYGMYGGQTFKPAKKLWTINMPGAASTSTWASGNWGTDLVVADTKAEAIEKFKAWSEAQGEKVPTEAKATSFDIYSYRSKPGITIVGKRINSTKSIDLKEFTSVKEAREYKAGNQTELEALLAKAKFEPSERGESNAPRVGADHRSGADVTSEQFRETFGFRGEQFGASMPQSERQANMNQAYDALMDLAGVVGIPPKALSLNGELGLAFGARGTGGKNPAAAHYERDTTGAVTPNRVVINLTRKNGAGSLGHEWFHAVDNYFARMRGEKAGMLTESHASRGEGVRPEMVAAFKQLMMAIQSSGVRERSKQLDKKRVKDYWSTGLEMAARSFESYVIAKLQDNNGSNDYLANIVPESLYAMQSSYPYPVMGEMPAIRAAFDNFFNTVQTKETDQGVAMFSRSGSGKSDVLSKDGKFKGWPKFNTWTRQEYSDVVSLLPDAYRNDAHRREPVAAKDWDALAAAVLPELEALNNAAGEGAFRLDPLGNIIGDVRRYDSSVFASELVDIANRHDLGIFLTGLRTSSMAPLTEMGFVPEMGLGAILARATGSTAPVMPMASGTVNNTAYGTMMSYRPRGFAAPMFSKAESGASQQPTRGTPVPRVQAVVDAITANWANAPEVVVVSDMQDAKVPQRVREADQLAKSQGAEGEPDGFIYKGTVYLVAAELPSINDAIRVLMHESAHAGFRGLFGDTLKPILSQVAAFRRADIVTKAREYGLLNPDTPRGATVNEQWQAMTEKNRQVAAEEVLAVMAQTQPELGFVKRAVAAIRNWLRTNVPGFKSMLMTDADIIQAFILPARRHIEGGQAKAIQPIHDANLAALSRSQDQTDTPAFKAWFEGSKVVDADGSPLVVYHGTGADISEFKTEKIDGGIQGAWFTSNPSLSGEYAVDRAYSANKREFFKQNPHADRLDKDFGQSAANVMPVYLMIKNPLRVEVGDIAGVGGMDFVDSKYDGVIVGDFEEVIVRNPAQIKSAISNNGQFDPANPDIRYSRATVARNSWDGPEASGFDDLVYKLQDKQIDTKRVVEAIKAKSSVLDDEKNVYLQEELFHGRAAARTEDFVNKELGPLVNMMKMRGIDIPMLDEYLHARHAEEANKLIAERNKLPNAGQLDTSGNVIESPLQDGGSGMTTQAARDYLAKLTPAERTRLDAVAAKVDDILANTRQLYADYDLESQDKVDGWGTMFKHYVPLMREDKDGGMGIGQGFSIKGKEVKGRTGSTRKVVDILANIALQRERAIVRGEKNRVATALVGLVKLNPNKEFWHVGPPPAQKVYDPDSNSVVERLDPMYKSRDNVVVAKIKGKDGSVSEQAVTFNEGDARAVRMASALKNLDAAQLEGLLGVSAKITRYFAAINTQYNPIFGTVNLVRDVQGALFNLSSTPLKGRAMEIARYTMSALKGIYLDARAARNGKTPSSQWATLWEEFQDEGGQTGFRDLFANSADRAKAIERELNPTAWMDGPLGKVFTANGALKVPFTVAQKKATGMFDWLSDYNLAMENAVRLAAYKVAKEQGISKQQSASLGKNLTVNFNRKGQVGQQAGALYAFFNASMQGTARLGQTLFDMEPGKPKTLRMSATGKKIVYGGVLLGAMQALLLAAAGFDDEEPPDFVRERSLIIPTGGKTYITIPMPLGLHVLPNMGRIPMEFAMGGGKDPAQHVAKILGLLAGSFNPIGGGVSLVQMLAPTAIDPLVAIAENKDWTGKPIAKTAYNKATPGHLLAKDTATYPAKVLAEAINIMSGGTEYTAGVLSPTPDQIDYLFGQVTGGVGREASKLQQSASAIYSGEDLPVHKVPLVGRFYGDTDTQSAQSGKFYSAINKLNVHEAEIKGLRKDGRGAEAAKYIQENPDSRLFVAANFAEREVQKLRAAKRALITKGAPADEVKAVETRINDRMTRFNLTVQRLRENEAG